MRRDNICSVEASELVITKMYYLYIHQSKRRWCVKGLVSIYEE